MEKIVLIDGFSIINRAFYGVPEMTNSAGLHTNGVYGFLNMMFKILEDEKPDYLTVAFDVKAPTFRHLMYEGYKGTRKGMPAELLEQVPVLKDVLKAMGIPTVEKADYEADDILGTIAKACEAKGMQVSLVSGDRDLLQIATDNICIVIPKTKKGKTEIERYHTKDVIDLYQVTPTEFIDVKALMGDPSDNIPGVPGVGEKTAIALISKFHSIENIKAHLDEVTPARAKNAMTNHYDLAELSKVLAAIKIDCEIDFDLAAARYEDIFTTEACEWVKRLEFKSMLSRFSKETLMAGSESASTVKQYTISNASDYDVLTGSLANVSEFAFKLYHDGRHALNSIPVLYAAIRTQDALFTCSDEEWISACVKLITQTTCKKFTIGLKEQLPALSAAGQVREEEYEDLKIMAYLLNPMKDDYDYDDIARDYREQIVMSRKDLIGKESIQVSAEKNPSAMLQLAGFEGQTILEAYPVLKEKLKESGMDELYCQVEMPLVFTLASMQKYGIRTDKEALSAYSEKLGVMVSALEMEIYELAGESFNINSPKQLGVILFEKLGLPAAKKTKTGYSTSADVLDKLRPDYPIVDKVLNYRTVTKLKSTYADGLAAYILEDGRIHGNFHQTITATGRISSSDPNLQNIPVRMELGRELRKIFIAEEGYTFVDADYSQIEIRVLAHMSGDQTLINAYNQGKDIHAITASQVFNVPLEEVTPLMRRNAKAVNFGIIYGISAFGLSEDLKITRKEAQQYMNQYFASYPSIQEFLNRLVSDAKDQGLTKTLDGRIRPVPELKSSNFMQRSFGERIAMNAPIQGTAADIIKKAMVRVNRRLEKECKDSRLILQIHDELLIEAKKEELELVEKILAEEMTNAAKLSVALEIDMHTGSNWFDAH